MKLLQCLKYLYEPFCGNGDITKVIDGIKIVCIGFDPEKT